ncbi:YciI family protein [Saccharopolyspora sp. ASAGF58]|uniref:YciI family protein n=1 Tax=Saccharopolyspora sp. ASAGF58 TaxID=2719023 RepID=UPI001FF0C4F6|nr:YciI family protein [Saccharopolyspora sp. ASAGF58]
MTAGDDLDLSHYHDELVQAGVLLAGDLAAGFWLLEVDSRAEAAEWGRRVPRADVEIREVTGS